ncbi:MAG: hypothetical protein A3J97_03405 [Spirochaetes bacterium RIFOXYC1_FULL_54_7]|nr:MAG: hypothetical protein A3J97_03405 [Spirochaetes bacterium RIFOXYC1_FULL_54_7]
MSAYGHVLFYTSAAAFRAEGLVKRLPLPLPGARLVPTPRELSSDCGVALRFALDDRSSIQSLLDDAKVPYDRIEG